MRAAMYFGVMVLLAWAGLVAGATIYVDADASGVNDGSSWIDAFKYLQDALVLATNGDEIWVAEGTYKPDQGYGIAMGDRTAAFDLMSGLAIYGGFTGYEAVLSERDWMKNETILSGDLSGDDLRVQDPLNLLTEPTRAENSYTVITAYGVDSTAIIDGFTITGGQGNGTTGMWPYDRGGGVYNSSGQPTFANCTFEANSARNGGGMSNDYAYPTLINCIFRYNSSGHSAGGVDNNWGGALLVDCTFTDNVASFGGGAMYNQSHVNVDLVRCFFSENIASDGGAIRNTQSTITLNDCSLRMNQASYNGGGGIASYSSDLTLINCTLDENYAPSGGALFLSGTGTNSVNCVFSENVAGSGGAIASTSSSGSYLSNCTFTENSASSGNSLALDSWQKQSPSVASVVNCIIWDGENSIWNNDDSSITVAFSDVKGGWLGIGNIDEVPLFVGSGDYRLLSGSPCIDAGDDSAVTTSIDLDGNPRIQGAAVDMGAYETAGAPDDVLNRVIDIVGELDPDSLANPNSGHTLANMLEAVIVLIEGEHYEGALASLQKSIFPKMDGCALRGEPDKDDWITTCEAQQKVYPLVLQVIQLLQALI